jgi:hypothetical protein
MRLPLVLVAREACERSGWSFGRRPLPHCPIHDRSHYFFPPELMVTVLMSAFLVASTPVERA